VRKKATVAAVFPAMATCSTGAIGKPLFHSALPQSMAMNVRVSEGGDQDAAVDLLASLLREQFPLPRLFDLIQPPEHFLAMLFPQGRTLDAAPHVCGCG